MSFDVRAVFKSLSDSMRAEFERSAQIPHSTGKGSAREDAVRDFLRTYLPAKYSISQGQIIHSSNRISKQTDVVIYDCDNCPRLLANETHSIFPLESVYGTVEVKSVLSSDQLAEAFNNITSVKSLVEDKSVVFSSFPIKVDVAAPLPVGIVFAFAADRSIEAIATQAKQLQAALPDPRHAPDLIVVLGLGLVGPRRIVRDESNVVRLPEPAQRMAVREVRRHTLLRFYLQLLSELATIRLPPLIMERYLEMPELIDDRRVSGHGPLFMLDTRKPLPAVPVLKKIGAAFIRRVLAETKDAKPITYREHFQHTIGNADFSQIPKERLDATVVEHNPRSLPPLMTVGFDPDTRKTLAPTYAPTYIVIDGQDYAIDCGTMTPSEWEDADVEFDEVWDQRPTYSDKKTR